MGYNDPDDDRNSELYQTGKACIEMGCDNPAGTAWSPLWCFECNMKRLDRLNEQFSKLTEGQ